MHRLLLALVFLFSALLRAQTDTPYRTPSPALAALVTAPPTPFVVLSPDRTRLLLLERAESPIIIYLIFNC